MTAGPADSPPSAGLLVRRNTERWLIAYACCLGLTLILARSAMGAGPGPRAVALAIFMLGAAAVLRWPVAGIYLTVFLALLGDGQLAGWYPFGKNLSSWESALFVHPSIIVSPLEVYIVLTAAAVGLRAIDGRAIPLPRGPLLWPIATFTGLVLLALLHGLLTGGNVNIALWEVRPIMYAAALFVLTSMLLTRREHYHYLIWCAVVAMLLEAIHSAYVINVSLAGPSGDFFALLGYLEHSASLHFNLAVALFAAAWVVRGASPFKRWLLPVPIAAMVPVYLAAERRSAVVALAGAIILVMVVLLTENKRAFWWAVPVLVVVGAVYSAAFWNVQGGVGFPAQAIKSVVAPNQLGEADFASNLYRDVETYNLVATIRARPLTGLGFGHRFYRPFPLPWLPFAWAEYFPHNSVLWIWINTGIVGFVSMLYLMATSVSVGVRALPRLKVRDDAALTLTAVLFVVMYLIFAYVDIAWDAQSMVLLGVCFAIIDFMHRRAEAGPEPPEPGVDVAHDSAGARS